MPGALYSSRGNSLVLIKSAQGSSIGSYSTQWMNEFYCSAKGESAESWLDDSRAKRMKLPYPPMKILYPSLRTVKDSVLGELVRFFCISRALLRRSPGWRDHVLSKVSVGGSEVSARPLSRLEEQTWRSPHAFQGISLLPPLSATSDTCRRHR